MLKLLNNIGIVGAVLAAVADLAFVLIMVLGVQINTKLSSIIIFSVVNALVGIMINILLRYQGKKYAELENTELCNKFYDKQVREKKYLPIGWWMALSSLKDILVKGVTTSFSIFGMIYLSIEGSKNPIQILMTIATLIMFACFGLIAMNGAYERFYNVQIPFMEMKIKDKKENESNVENR